ncbi:MAG: ATP-binding protein, partial [Limosilactobacillus sp.]|nr:ATP-binding protein [Limosilactobacillus sp.]
LGAIANELAAQGISTVMLHYPSFLVKMRESIQDGTLAAKRQHVSEAPVLMIDDIGAETVTAWGRDEILGVILEYRLHNNLPTFFSSNLDWEALEQHLAEDNKGVVEPMKAKRLMQRITTLSKVVTLDGRNLRIK